MDTISQILRENKQFLESKKSAGLVPTNAQLADFLRKLTTSLGPPARECDEKIRNMIREEFSCIGWDVAGNKSLSPSPPTVSEISALLGRLEEAIKNIENGADIDSVNSQLQSAHIAEAKTDGTDGPQDAWLSVGAKFEQRDKKIELAVKKGTSQIVGTGVELAKGSANTVALSGQDRTRKWIDDRKHQIWSDDDAKYAWLWCKEDTHRIPNKKNAHGGRLFRLVNILWNGCDAAHGVIDRTPNAKAHVPNRTDEGRKMYIAPLAEKVLELMEEEEEEKEGEEDF